MWDPFYHVIGSCSKVIIFGACTFLHTSTTCLCIHAKIRRATIFYYQCKLWHSQDTGHHFVLVADSVSSEPVQAEIINKIYKYTLNKSLYLSVNVFSTGHFPDPIGI